MLFHMIFDKYPVNLLKASSWKMLKDFGGDQTIDEFRKNFQIVSYSDIGQYIRKMPTSPVNELLLENKSN